MSGQVTTVADYRRDVVVGDGAQLGVEFIFGDTHVPMTLATFHARALDEYQTAMELRAWQRMADSLVDAGLPRGTVRGVLEQLTSSKRFDL